MANQKKHPSRVQGFESLREFGDDVKNQLDAKSSWDEVWSEVFGAKKKSSDFHKPENLTVANPFLPDKQDVFRASEHQNAPKKKEKMPLHKEAAYDHNTFVKSSEIASRHEMRELNQKMQEIMAELQRLISSSKELQMEFGGVSVDQAPKQAGEYHINFLDFLKGLIIDARKKVESSGMWKNAKSKKGGKGKWGNKQRQDWFSNTSLSMGNESGGGYINQTG